jgi:type IV secretory system conjugative DNA transfer VirD4/TraG family protein
MKPAWDTPRNSPPLDISPEILFVFGFIAFVLILYYVGIHAFYFSCSQMTEICGDLVLLGLGSFFAVWYPATAKSRRENQWPHPPFVPKPIADLKHCKKAWAENSVVLGYDVHGRPFLWPDRIRVMQGIVLGMTGTGKTTLLKNIISQDLARTVETPDGAHHIPMVIFDGKGDMEFFYDLLPHIHHAGRMHQLRVLNPARPDISFLYNPFHCSHDDYMAVVNMVFGSFNLHDEFFAKHQLNYLADIVRVLVYTGVKFNFYDVLVMALDEEVLKEQVNKARNLITRDSSVSSQRKLNFEMSVKNLYKSLEDRERVPKIQGLLNECMTFLDDELSIITGPYEDLLSLDDVIDQNLILFVSLNVNKNTEPVRALGKMLLQNLQLVVGKRYERAMPQEPRVGKDGRASHGPLFSVILDEFAPFGYQNFAHILNTARGTNTAFLFSMQSIPQLLRVGKGFKEDVTSAPNTTIVFKTQNEETARYFLQASALHRVPRRSVSLRGWRMFGYERFEATGRVVETEQLETRAADFHIKNLPKGQVEILMTDESEGTLLRSLHVRPPADVSIPGFKPELYPRLRHSRGQSQGANLRFKNNELATRHGRRWYGGPR